MFRHSETTLAAIKRSIDIVALVGDYLQLHRKGSKYKAVCPFHDDHNPSLEVNPDRQTFKCWSCGTGGDIFDFVKEYERVDFPEALRMLADRAGITLEQSSNTAVGGDVSKTDLLGVLAWAKETFREALRTLPEAAEAREYLASRRIAPTAAERFEIGYAPSSRGWLSARAKRQGYSLSLLEKVGLLTPSEDSEQKPRERFHGRLVFPIHDPRGRVIAFGGRILPSTEKKLAAAGTGIAKYVNSPETTLFQKRRVLYGAHLAREASRKQGWVAVVEGYTDVVAANQVGLPNVVGTLGTALGDDHVRGLQQLADKVVLVFDGDAAGQAAADRALELFLGHTVDLRLLTLPSGLDPCDFLLDQGPEAFLSLVQTAVDPLSFVIDRSTARFDLNSIEQSRQAAEAFLTTLLKTPRVNNLGMDPRIGKALDRFSNLVSGIPVKTLHSRLENLRREQVRTANRRPTPRVRSTDEIAGVIPVTEPVRPTRPSDLDPIDREIVQLALNESTCVPKIMGQILPGELRSTVLRPILQACFDLYSEGYEPNLESVMIRLQSSESRSLAAALVAPIDPNPLPNRCQPSPISLRLTQVLARFAERKRLDRINDLKAALRETDSASEPDQYQSLLNEYLSLWHHRPDPGKANAS